MYDTVCFSRLVLGSFPRKRESSIFNGLQFAWIPRSSRGMAWNRLFQMFVPYKKQIRGLPALQDFLYGFPVNFYFLQALDLLASYEDGRGKPYAAGFA